MEEFGGQSLSESYLIVSHITSMQSLQPVHVAYTTCNSFHTFLLTERKEKQEKMAETSEMF